MCSTGMTGQSSKRGTCVIPKTYLHFTETSIHDQTLFLSIGKHKKQVHLKNCILHLTSTL